MKKKDNFFASTHYVAPGCKVVEIKTRRVVCGSPVFGGINKAGQTIDVDDDYDY